MQPVESKTVRLEGTELSDDERYRQVVTFSYWLEDPPEHLQDVGMADDLFRKHTTIKLRAADGELFGVLNVAG